MKDINSCVVKSAHAMATQRFSKKIHLSKSLLLVKEMQHAVANQIRDASFLITKEECLMPKNATKKDGVVPQTKLDQ